MTILTVDNITDVNYSFSSTLANKGSCKAWINFSLYPTFETLDSFNIAGVGTTSYPGEFVIYFKNGMSNANYVPLIKTTFAANSVPSFYQVPELDPITMIPSRFIVQTNYWYNYSTAPFNPANVYISVFGD
jgi:hypothetical protein